MKKIISVLAGAALFALPFAASAMTVDSLTFQNGQPNIQTSSGSSIDANATFILSGSDALDSVSVEFPGYGGAEQCFVVNPALIQPGINQVPLNGLVVPNNVGNWNMLVKGHGETWPSVDTNCDPGTVKVSKTFNEVVNIPNATVTTSNSNNSSSTSSSSQPAWLGAFEAFILAQLKPATPPATGGGTGTGTVSVACQEFNADVAAASPGSITDANSTLQGFLIGKHMSIPALKAGAAWGFDGSQTQAASSAYRAQAGC